MKTKFRVWDKKYKRFLDGGEVIFDLYNNNTCEIVINELGYDNTIDRQSDFIVMQYTGINDKNGKEIYEGDIIKNNPDGDISVVYFDEEELQFCTKNNIYCQCPLFTFYDFEIIGNVYENSNLFIDYN